MHPACSGRRASSVSADRTRPRRPTESFAKMGTLRTMALTLAGAAALAAGAGVVVVYAGLYDVGATRQHLQPVYSLLETAMRQSVRLRPLGKLALLQVRQPRAPGRNP